MNGKRRPLKGHGHWLEITRGDREQSAGRGRAFPRRPPDGDQRHFSGSGKSSLMRSVLLPAAQQALARNAQRKKAAATGAGNGASARRKTGARAWESFAGADYLEGVYEVDQSPIGKTTRSTPATYVGVLDEIRLLFAQLPLVAHPRVFVEPVFVQQRGRALRELPGAGRHQARDEFPADELRAVRGLRRVAVQRANPGGAVQRPQHRRGHATDDRAGGGILRARCRRSIGRCRC